MQLNRIPGNSKECRKMSTFQLKSLDLNLSTSLKLIIIFNVIFFYMYLYQAISIVLRAKIQHFFEINFI